MARLSPLGVKTFPHWNVMDEIKILGKVENDPRLVWVIIDGKTKIKLNRAYLVEEA